MRRGIEPDIVYIDNVFVGFNLNADFCTEHEIGIKEIRRYFKIDSDKIGIEKRKIRTIPNEGRLLDLITRENNKTLLFTYDHMIKHFKEGEEIHELHLWSDKPLACAWDEGSFGILTNKYQKELEELYEYFKKHDIVISLLGGGVFQNAGLHILIASRIPQKIQDEWKKADLDRIELEKADEKTKIRKILEKSKKSWFSLSPQWKTENFKTEYKVVYWLNPMEQNIHNSGWFTVEDLQLWAEDKGPVIKTKKRIKET